MFSSAVWHLLCKSGLLSRIVQSRHSVLFVIVGVNKFVTIIVLVKSRQQSRIYQSQSAFLSTVLYSLCKSHKNDYSDEFIDTNYYNQNKQNDDFKLYVTKDRFYKAYSTLPTKTPTDFDKYVTAA